MGGSGVLLLPAHRLFGLPLLNGFYVAELGEIVAGVGSAPELLLNLLGMFVPLWLSKFYALVWLLCLELYVVPIL